MKCVACNSGQNWECLEQGECNDNTRDTERSTDSSIPEHSSNNLLGTYGSDESTEVEADVSDEPEFTTYKDDSALRDQQSTGRKRAAKMYPLDPEMDCEWKMKKNCGGGEFPIVGCLSGKQQARHHGPEKNTLNNEKGNVHRICHKCLGENVRILTADLRWIPAGEIHVGMELIGFSENISAIGHSRTVFKRSTVEDVSRVIEPSYQMHMANGAEMLVSHNHLWVASTPGRHHVDWRATERLKSGYNLRRLVEPWEIDNSREAGWFAGFLDGEGSLSGTQLTCAQKDNNDGIADKMWDMFRKYTQNDLHETIREANGNNQQVTVARVANLPDILRLIGTVRPERFIPRFPDFVLGKSPLAVKDNRVAVKELQFVGEREVISIQTSSKTFIAEGFLSHNCHNRWHTLNDENYVWDGVHEPHDPCECSVVDIVMNEEFWVGRKLIKAKD